MSEGGTTRIIASPRVPGRSTKLERIEWMGNFVKQYGYKALKEQKLDDLAAKFGVVKTAIHADIKRLAEQLKVRDKTEVQIRLLENLEKQIDELREKIEDPDLEERDRIGYYKVMLQTINQYTETLQVFGVVKLDVAPPPTIIVIPESVQRAAEAFAEQYESQIERKLINVTPKEDKDEPPE